MSKLVLQIVSQKLPRMPKQVVTLLEALESPEEYTLPQIAHLVGNCGRLEEVVLDMLNSGFFKTRRRAKNIEDAFLLIGFAAVRSVILGTVIKILFPRREIIENFDRDLFLRHCLGTALATEMLCEKAGLLDILNRYSLITYGFTHDIGTLALDYCLPVTLNRIYAYAKHAGVTILQAERTILTDLDHGIVGELVCRLWQLPTDITNVVTYHHMPRRAPGDKVALLAVNAGDRVSWNYYEGLLGNHKLRHDLDSTILSELGLTLDDAREVEGKLPEMVDQAMELLNIRAIEGTLLS